jgi:hypothetical protein
MSDEIKVSRIVLKVRDAELSLSVDEARLLRDSLEDLIGPKGGRLERHDHHHWGWNYPVYSPPVLPLRSTATIYTIDLASRPAIKVN